MRTRRDPDPVAFCRPVSWTKRFRLRTSWNRPTDRPTVSHLIQSPFIFFSLPRPCPSFFISIHLIFLCVYVSLDFLPLCMYSQIWIQKRKKKKEIVFSNKSKPSVQQYSRYLFLNFDFFFFIRIQLNRDR